MRILANESKSYLHKSITVSGWVNSRRDHGGLIFIDLRDHTGILQLVVTPETADAFKLAETVRDEFVLRATGKLRERAPELVNPNLATGDIELVVDSLELLNRSAPLPVNTHDDGPASSEEIGIEQLESDRDPAACRASYKDTSFRSTEASELFLYCRDQFFNIGVSVRPEILGVDPV